MASVSATPNVPSTQSDAQVLGKNWFVFLLLGSLMVAFGAFVLGFACLTTLTVAAVWLFGALLIAGGAAQILNAFWAGRWSGRLVHLLVGTMYLLVGIMFMSDPEKSAIRLTLIISIFLMASGLLRIVFAMSEKFHGSRSVLLNGIITLILGIMIYRQWPVSGLWAIGMFIGVEMLFNGWAWIMLSLMARRAKPDAA